MKTCHLARWARETQGRQQSVGYNGQCEICFRSLSTERNQSRNVRRHVWLYRLVKIRGARRSRPQRLKADDENEPVIAAVNRHATESRGHCVFSTNRNARLNRLEGAAATEPLQSAVKIGVPQPAWKARGFPYNKSPAPDGVPLLRGNCGSSPTATVHPADNGKRPFPSRTCQFAPLWPAT